MRILLILPSLNPYGLQEWCINFIRILSSTKGVQFVVASSGGILAKDLEEMGIDHIRISNLKTRNPIKILINGIKIYFACKRHKIDIIHAKSRSIAWSSYIAKTFLQHTKLLCTAHAIYQTPHYLQKLYNMSITMADLVIAVSYRTKEHLVRHYAINPEKIVVVYQGINTAKYAAQAAQNKPTPIVLMLTKFSPTKGHELLIDAIKMLGNKNFRCIIASNQTRRVSYIQQILQTISNNKLGHIVQVVESEADSLQSYNIADIVVCASTHPEAFGRSIIEAQSMGKLVVVPDEGGPGEFVTHGVDGILFKPCDCQDLSTSIGYAIDILHTSHGVGIRNNAIKNAQKFSLENSAKNLLEVYNRAANL